MADSASQTPFGDEYSSVDPYGPEDQSPSNAELQLSEFTPPSVPTTGHQAPPPPMATPYVAWGPPQTAGQLGPGADWAPAAPPPGTYSAYYPPPAVGTPYAAPGIPGQPMPRSPVATGLRPHPWAPAVFTMGLLALILGGLFTPLAILGPIAMGLGLRAKGEVRRNPGLYQPSGLLTAGWILGLIATVLLVIAGFIFVVYFVATAASM